MQKNYSTNNIADANKIVAFVAKIIKPESLVLLQGNIGAGKTTFVKILSKLLGFKKNVSSPTFILMNILKSQKNKRSKIKQLVHIDCYRLKNDSELIEIGAIDYAGEKNTLMLIEWPELAKKSIKKLETKFSQIIKIKITAKKQNKRLYKISIKDTVQK